MSEIAHSSQFRTVPITVAEREWICRQGITARALADIQRQVRAGVGRNDAEVTRVREQLRRDRRRFERHLCSRLDLTDTVDPATAPEHAAVALAGRR